MHISDIICIDFEVSGITRDAWPIEVGLAWMDSSYPIEQNPGQQLKSWAAMIRPEPDWCESSWDIAAQDIHGIDIATVKACGRSARSVAEESYERLRDKIIVSDAPAFDSRWLRKLLDTCPKRTPFVMQDFDGVAAALSSRHSLQDVWTYLEKTPAPHRAGEDAARLMRALVGLPY